MAMIYTLASYVKEWLDGTFVEDLRQAATAEIEAARRQEEEVRPLHPWACASHASRLPLLTAPCPCLVSRSIGQEERRLAAAAGTAVTEEVFFEWKRKFDAEMAAKKAKEKGAKVDDKKKKLTGGRASAPKSPWPTRARPPNRRDRGCVSLRMSQGASSSRPTRRSLPRTRSRKATKLSKSTPRSLRTSRIWRPTRRRTIAALCLPTTTRDHFVHKAFVHTAAAAATTT